MIQLRLNKGKVEEGKVELTVLEAKTTADLSFSNNSKQISLSSKDIHSHMIPD